MTEFCIAMYDTLDGDCFGLFMDSYGKPWLYPTVEAAQKAAGWCSTLGFGDTRYEARTYHPEPIQRLGRKAWLEHLAKHYGAR